MTVLAAVCFVLAAMLLLPTSARQRVARLQPRRRRVVVRRRWGLWSFPVVVLVVAGGGLVLGGTKAAALGVSVTLIGGTVAGLWLNVRRARVADRRAEAVAEASQLLAGLLRVGHIPVTALRLAAAESEVFTDAVAAQDVGGSITATWRRQSQEPGGAGLADLAAAWAVCERSGASLTDTLDSVAEHLDNVRDLTGLVAAELSAPKATGRILAVLPFAGIGLGFAIGGNPVDFLTGSIVGQGCLVAGVALACAGVWWIERIADSASIT